MSLKQLAGAEDDAAGEGGILLLHRLIELEASHPRHPEIHQEARIGVILKPAQGGLGIRGGLDGIARRFQETAQDCADARVIVNHEYSLHGTFLSPAEAR
jgi:hypothetical protein